MNMEEEQQEILVHEEPRHADNTLLALHTLRRNKQFCDVVLRIGSHEIYAHKPVLACASPYFFELFSSSSEVKPEDRYKIGHDLDKDAVKKLVHYAYTGKLDVPKELVKSVYMAAYRLKMHQPAAICAQHMVQHLTPTNCIGVRSIPGLGSDPNLAEIIDAYIQQEIEKVKEGKELQGLPRIQIEVLQNTKEAIDATVDQQLCSMVVEWLRERIDTDEITITGLTEKMHMLYLNHVHTLQDCNDIQNGDANDSELIQDYKKKNEKLLLVQPLKLKKKSNGMSPARPRQLLYSKSLTDMAGQAGVKDKEWKVVAVYRSKATVRAGHKLLTIMSLGSRLTVVSIIQRHNIPTSPSVTRPPSVEKADTYQQFPLMSAAKCAAGVAELNGQLLVCGGYDRAECMKAVQQYDPINNVWTSLPHMRHPRGRFGIAVIGRKVYAVCGSDGAHELDTAECFDLDTNKWTLLPSLSVARCNAGVCALGDKVYCIGGWNGEAGMKRCQVFDPSTNSWSQVSSLIVGRYQVGVCALDGYVYAVGGCDGWNCLNTVERYDPSTNSWTTMASLATARRGCGVAVLNGKLYAVGGSDGTHSLCSVEIYDPIMNAWTPGKNMTSVRANVGAATVAGALYAVGGFTGKMFLNTFEYLDSETNEWTTFTSLPDYIPYTNGHLNGDQGNAKTNGCHVNGIVRFPDVIVQNGDVINAKGDVGRQNGDVIHQNNDVIHQNGDVATFNGNAVSCNGDVASNGFH